ncbi:MAG: hypothetical protein AABZ00_17715 [Chloroflexota bacterium]
MATSLLIIFSTIFLGFVLILVIAYVLQHTLVGRFWAPVKQISAPSYPKPNDELLQQLEMIESSQDSGIDYKPCIVTLLDGRKIDCVYVVSTQPYLKHWGVLPENDKGKHFLRIQDIVKIEESPSRLPPKIANELYQAGESGMGYCRFTLVFSDNTEQEYVTGNAIDFVQLPAGKSNSDVIKVLPHTGSGKNYAQGLKYYWCLYD